MTLRVEVININKYGNDNDDYIYVGRPSPFGNPYSSKEKSSAYKVDTKKEAIQNYRDYILSNLDILDHLISELKINNYNKIGCYCKPSSCHGDVLKDLIKERTTKSII